jgi:hypothetical protein
MPRYDEDAAIEILKAAIANSTPTKSLYENLIESGLSASQIQAMSIKLGSQIYEKTTGPIMIPRIGTKKAGGR